MIDLKRRQFLTGYMYTVGDATCQTNNSDFSFNEKMRKPKARTVTLACICLFILIVMHFSSYRKNSNDIMKEEIRLVILILSAPNNVERRNVIRKTWLSQKNDEVKHYFVVGLSDLSANQKFSLHTEDSLYEDLLLLPNVKDSYRGITKKVLYSMRHIHEVHEFSYLLKCDDDSFVLVEELLVDLNSLQNQETNQELYWGFFDGRAKAKKSGQWMEKEWFLCDYYLPYALGGGYVLSYNLVEFISNNYKILK